MVTIVDSQLRQTIWETVYDRINGGSYSTSVAPTITAAFIDNEHSSFPQIIINPIDVDKEAPAIGSDRTTCNKTITINIDLFTKKNKDLDILSDEVDDLMNNQFTGFCLTSESEINGELYPNEQKLRVKTLSYTVIRR